LEVEKIEEPGMSVNLKSLIGELNAPVFTAETQRRRESRKVFFSALSAISAFSDLSLFFLLFSASLRLCGEYLGLGS
jgi:hypothetical protein